MVERTKGAGSGDETSSTPDDAAFGDGGATAAPVEQAESVAALARSSRPRRRDAEVVEKAAPTPRRRAPRAETKPKRTTPAQFMRESVDELKKVVWPTSNQVRQYFVVVLIFVLFIIAYVSVLDLGFGAALLKLFG